MSGWNERVANFQPDETGATVRVERILFSINLGVEAFCAQIMDAAKGLDNATFMVGWNEDEQNEEWWVCGFRPRTPEDMSDIEALEARKEVREREQLRFLIEKYGANA